MLPNYLHRIFLNHSRHPLGVYCGKSPLSAFDGSKNKPLLAPITRTFAAHPMRPHGCPFTC